MIFHSNKPLFCAIFLLLAPLAIAVEVPKRPADLSFESLLVLDGVPVTDITETWFGPHYSKTETEKLISKLGYVYSNNSIVRHTKSAPGKTNGYSVIYRINEFGQRILDSEGKKDKHLIVAGDSHTFGVGVKDSETLQSVLGRNHPQYHVYNFGHGGGSVNNTLALLENFPWEKNIKESEGKMIYLFSAGWMYDRVIGSKSFTGWDRGQSPWYYLENDQLNYGGQFKDRFLTKIFKMVNTIDYFGWIGELPKVNKDHFRLVAKILVKMKAEYLQKFPKGQFIAVVSYYGAGQVLPLADQLMVWLKELGVDAVAIQTNDIVYGKKNILVDYHFDFEGQKVIEKEISGKIKF